MIAANACGGISDLQFAAAVAAKLGSGRIFLPAICALMFRRCTNRRSALIAKTHSLRVFCAALRANRQCQRRSAVVAKFSGACRLSAGWANYCFAFKFSFPYVSIFGCFFNIAAHGICSCFGNCHLLSGRTVGAEHFILVVA